MLHMLSRNWWLVAIRGVAAIVFGLLAFALPGLTLVTLVFLFGAFALVDGAAMLVAAIRGDPGTLGHRWLLVLIGAAGVTAGIVTWIDPTITALALLYAVATWAVIIGAIQIVAAVLLRRQLTGELWLLLGGVVSVIFGVALFVEPGSGLFAITWLVGAYAIVFGVTHLALALRLRGLHVQSPARTLTGVRR
ncbi:MAG TPA: HdeD family acid-resistance protein [Candidatus Acidoferrum sp.]|nr:HdeD family acid-resistance protein [Candidatus Acidoferrum sp.]